MGDLKLCVDELRPCSFVDVEGQLSEALVLGDRSLRNAVDQQGQVTVLDLHRQLVPVAGQCRGNADFRDDLGRLGRRRAVIRLDLTTSHRSSISTPTTSPQSNLRRARRSCTTIQHSPHWLQWDAPNSPRKVPLPFNDHHPI